MPISKLPIYTLLCCVLCVWQVHARAQAPVTSIQAAPGGLEGNSVCQNSTVTFTSASVDVLDSADYDWLFGYGAVPFQATGPGPHEVSLTIDGPRTVVLLVDNHNGTPASAAQLAFDVVTPPVPVIEGPTEPVCAGVAFACLQPIVA